MKVLGVKELTDNLKRIADRATNPDVNARALRRAGEPMRAAMAERAPRSDQAPHIADNIVIDVQEQRDGAAVSIGPARGFGYGFHLEFGTVHMPAQPFMRPAFDEGKDRAIAHVGADLWNEITK